MLDRYYKLLNPAKTMEHNLKAIIEAFVTFYGEEERNRIEERFNSMILIGYQSPENIDRIISSIESEVSKSMITEFFSRINVEETEENFELYLGKNNLNYYTYNPLMNYEKYLESYNLGSEGRYRRQKLSLINMMKRYIPSINEENYNEYVMTPKFQKIIDVFWHVQGDPEPYLREMSDKEYQRQKDTALKLLSKLFPEINIENIDEYQKTGKLSQVEHYLKEFKHTLQDYQAFLETLSPYTDYVSKQKARRERINRQYMEQLSEEFKEYLDEEDLEKFKKGEYFCEKVTSIIGNNLEHPPLIDSFSQSSEEELKNGSWRASSIEHDRIQYFKKMGIDLGPDYKDYENNPKCLSVLPPKEIIEHILKRRYELKNKLLTDYYTGLEEYQENMANIQQQGLTLELSYGPQAYEQKSTFVSPNIKYEDGQPILKPLVCISMEGIPEFLDSNIIHELNHLYELEFLEERESDVEFICGWDYVNQNKGQTEVEDVQRKDENKRQYELFSEIINELIAQEINAILFEQEIYTFGERDFSKIRGGTSYENTFFLIREFWQTYRNEIIASRKNNNIHIIYEAVGRENFDQLNSLFHRFHKNYSGFGFFNTIRQIEEGIDNEKTRGLNELSKERDEILAKMAEYHQTKTTTK